MTHLLGASVSPTVKPGKQLYLLRRVVMRIKRVGSRVMLGAEPGTL